MTWRWIKAFYPIFSCVEYDSLLWFSMVCDVSFWTFGCFFYNFYDFSHLFDKEKLVQKECFLEWDYRLANLPSIFFLI